MTDFEKLVLLFKSNPIEAITESQNLICSVTDFDSFKDFYLFHLHHPHMSTCQREWSTPQLAIHCYECSKNPQSCVCLECFLNGHHEGHDYVIRGNSCGNCDCGDLSMWKQTGFCADHHGVEENTHPEDYLDEKLRTILTDVIFKACFTSLLSLETDEDWKISPIIEFLASFLRFGDGFRRLIVISFTEKVGPKKIFSHIFDASKTFNEQLEKLCGGLINDDVFRCRISSTVCEVILERVMPEDFKFSPKKERNYDAWDAFWFHSFSPRPIEYSIKEKNWDWVLFTLEFTKLMKKQYALDKVSLEYKSPSYISEIAINIPRAHHAQTPEQIQLLFDKLFTSVLNCGSSEESPNDDKVVASFIDTFQENYYFTLYLFKCTFYYLIDCFKLKKDLILDRLFEELDKSVDIAPIFLCGINMIGDYCDDENDKFVSKFLKDSTDLSTDVNPCYFKSFHNGASFFYSLPLYDSILHLFRTDNINRVRIARTLSMEKYQSLRVRLGIITLKNILSYYCLHQSLTSMKNHSLKLFMSNLMRPVNFGSSLPFYLPLFQLLLGLQCKETDEFGLKEFFAFEMTREIGLFDNFESDDYIDEEIEPIKDQMTFSVLYMAILIVVERTLFNFNSFNFIEEQIIMALKSGISQLDELNNSFDSSLDSHHRQTFNKIISEVATTNRKTEKKEGDDTTNASFFLKKDVEWKSITALNLINTQKVILEKEITKNQNKLLQIPEFEEEEKYFFHEPRHYEKPEIDGNQIDEYGVDSSGLNIKLKEFLFTPTILAVVYQTLRGTSDEGTKNNVTLNDHLAMMILVLVSRFANEIESKDSSFNESTVIQYDSSLFDLIKNLKKTIFDQKETIKNTLNKKSFLNFINVKIGSPDHEPKSFVDILLEKGEVGKNVLIQMSVDISKYGFKDSNAEMTQAQINKKKAKKMKDDIMSQFKSAISNYNFVENDQLDENPSLSSTIGDACSICSTIKKDEILSYTVYMYRTKIPFAFDKPPMVKYNPQCEVPVDDDINDFLFEEDERAKILAEEDEEEDEEPNIDDFLESLERPQNEEEYQMYYLMRQLILESYRSKLRDFEEKKTRRQYKQKMIAYKENVIDSEAYKNGVSENERMITAGKNFVLQFSICQHPVHPTCINEKVFSCPIDRSRRNGFLPAIDGIRNKRIFKDYNANHDIKADSLTDEFQTSLQNFMDIYSSFFEKVDIFVELVKSISGLISTFEVRLRSLPDCLDSSKTKLLSRNLFLTTWYLYRLNGKPKMKLVVDAHGDLESRLTVFQRLIMRLIECDDLVQPDDNSLYTKHTKEVFMQIVSSFVNSNDFFKSSDPLRKQKELFLFLKRACLADYFLLNNMNVSNESEFSSLLDWDEILSVTNLSEYYKVDLGLLSADKNGEDFEFKPFVFCRIPKEFLRFALKPYNFKVELTHQFVLLNLIDYNFLIKNHDDFNESVINEDEELNKNQRNVKVFKPGASHLSQMLITEYSRCVYPSAFLSIGKSSSEVVIVNEKVLGSMEPFYVDRFGCEDLGYKRGMPLFLNEDRYERVIDQILSGDFSFCFQS